MQSILKQFIQQQTPQLLQFCDIISDKIRTEFISKHKSFLEIDDYYEMNCLEITINDRCIIVINPNNNIPNSKDINTIESIFLNTKDLNLSGDDHYYSFVSSNANGYLMIISVKHSSLDNTITFPSDYY